MTSAKVKNINRDVLRQCREQIGISLSDVEKRVELISRIEQGDWFPTFNQLDVLSKLYGVPRWVFVSESLPEEYQFEKAVPAYRQFADAQSKLFSNYKIRRLIAVIDRLRDFILELRDEMGEPIGPFEPPALQNDIGPEASAEQVRAWLGVEGNFDLAGWKEKLEEENIFIFMTGKYGGWSHVDKYIFRGLSLYHSVLPIIIINDSDAQKAQSFTLFHELGHLLRRENALDGWNEDHRRTEKWYDEFAGNVLMPASLFRNIAQSANDLDSIRFAAKRFKVSPYACLVRARQLNAINQATYSNFENILKAEYESSQERPIEMDRGPSRESSGGSSRNRPREVLNQYGRIYTKALFQAYHNKEIDLHKLCKLFDLKNASHALELEKQL